MKNYRVRRKRNRKILICIIIITLLVLFTTYSVRKERNLTFIEKTVKDVVIFIGDTLYTPVKFIKEKIEVYKEKDDIYNKYKNIKNEIDDIEQKNARITELENENEKLQDVLKIKDSLSSYDKINATVISRNVGYWYNKLVIDRGSKDGIKENMAVIISDGLIGYISEVSYTSSNVQLLNTPTFKHKISVKIAIDDNNFVTGFLSSFDTKKGLYKIEGVSYIGDINANSYVTTTGLSERFPSGILLGYVESITTDNFDLGKIILVKPSVNYENISYVTVLIRKAQSE